MGGKCDSVVADGLAERYLLGELDSVERETYELHYFECERCFGELRQLEAIQAALGSRAEPKSTRRQPGPGHRGWSWGALAVAAIAASLVAAWLLAPSAAWRPGAPARAQLLARLAQVEPPDYSPGVLRGVADDATAAFHEGMVHYQAREFAAAAPRLRTAAALDSARADFAFFHAASELLAGQVTAAVQEFGRTIALGDTPFLEEARFYLAKAYLAQGNLRGARQELVLVVKMQGTLQDDARMILQELEGVDADG